DARAMYLGSFQERMEETASPAKESEHISEQPTDEEDLQHAMDFSAEIFGEEYSMEFSAEAVGAQASPVPAGKEAVEGFRAPGDGASTAELLKFLIDRTG